MSRCGWINTCQVLLHFQFHVKSLFSHADCYGIQYDTKYKFNIVLAADFSVLN